MRTLVLFISGFTQSTRRSNGVFEMFLEALELRRSYGASDSRVEIRTWRDDWEATAEYCQALGVKRVYVAAYSWGVGWGLRKLAPKLKARGIEVPVLISCDGVYRFGVSTLGRVNPLSWRSIVNSGPLAPRIKIPSNVRQVYPLRQQVSKPRGHDFKVVNSQRTTLRDPVWVDLPHAEMDDSREFRELVGEMLRTVWANSVQ